MDSASGPRASVRRRIEFSDVDSSGRYHYGTVIRLIEAAEVELLAELGLLDSIYTSMPRARLEVDYVSTLRFLDEVEITVEVVDLGRTSVTFGFVIERDGDVCARAKLITVHVDGDGNPAPWPEQARACLAG
ncbi:MAG: acyl-CoA thioesterase [Solirubrobacterales bacterium]|nr:acyl-CoA thioesterase [Solirubrobacterales bacterium]HRV60347.1 thioesterase family protein [Solirubrobacterales bacterium]